MRVEGSNSRWLRVSGPVIGAVALVACAHGTFEDTTGAGGNLTVSTSSMGNGPTTSSNATSSSSTTTSSDASTSASSTSASSTGASSTGASSTSASSSASSTSSTSASSSSTTTSTSSGGTTSSFKAQYLAKITVPTTQQVNFYLEVLNTGSASVPLSDLKARYWFTADGFTAPLVFECDYTAVAGGCKSLTSSFGTASSASADHYLEVGFVSAATKLNPGAKSGEIQIRIHTSSFDNFTQTNDYSFDPAKTSYQDAPKVTLYQNGTLVWGTEP